MTDEVILVDADNREIGTCGKLEAHERGLLHRAFSIFVFHPDGRLLLQQRAQHKYHSGGLWTNTCCSHPRPGEAVLEAAHRRLMEEMGFDCALEEVHTFTYRVSFPNGLTEHEYDHVIVGVSDAVPAVNTEEVGEWRWVAPDELRADIEAHPDRYTYWFRTVLEEVLAGRTA